MKKTLIAAGIALFAAWVFWKGNTRSVVGDSSVHEETAPIRTSQAPLPSAGVSPGSPTQKVSEEEFRSLAQKTLQSFPTLEEIRSLPPEAVHDTPEPLRRAAFEMGKIAQLLHDQPELRPEAERFYADCAVRADLPSTLRALCYADLGKLGALSRLEEGDVPGNVRELAAKLKRRGPLTR